MANLTEEQTAELRQAFSLFEDGMGGLNAEGLFTAMRALGLQVTDTEVDEMIKEFDTDGSGSIEFPEFRLLMARKIESTNVEEDIKEAFRVFDKDGNGTILADDFRVILRDVGERLDDEEVERLVLSAKRSEDDAYIYYEDFVRRMMGR